MTAIFITETIDYAVANGAIIRGYTDRVTVTIQGKPDVCTGMISDFGDVKPIFKAALDDYDHRLLVTSSDVKASGGGVIRAYGKQDRWGPAMYCLLIMADLEDQIKPLVVTSVTARNICADPYTDVGLPTHYAHCLFKHKGVCKRMHGHSSRVVAITKDGAEDRRATSQAVELLRGAFVVSSDKVDQSSNTGVWEMRTDDCLLALPKRLFFLLPAGVEATAENIVERLFEMLAPHHDIAALVLYEGINKGAIAGEHGAIGRWLRCNRF